MFSYWFVVKIVLFVYKDLKTKKEAGVNPFKEPWHLFHLFSSFQTHVTILQQINVKKCPSSIRRRDSNPQQENIFLMPTWHLSGNFHFGFGSIRPESVLSGSGFAWTRMARSFEKHLQRFGLSQILIKHLFKKELLKWAAPIGLFSFIFSHFQTNMNTIFTTN